MQNGAFDVIEILAEFFKNNLCVQTTLQSFDSHALLII